MGTNALKDHASLRDIVDTLDALSLTSQKLAVQGGVCSRKLCIDSLSTNTREARDSEE